jgi:hypothetical protein
MKAKYESSYDQYFPEESAEYYSLLLAYAKLKDESFIDAFWIAQKALILSDRYNTISTDAAKLDTVKNGNRTDIKAFFYGRYRTLQLCHEHARSIWKSGNDSARNYGKGTV